MEETIIVLTTSDLFLIGLVTIILIMLVVFVIKISIRMVAQLSPDAHIKPVKTVLIEGEILDILIETELSPNTT